MMHTRKFEGSLIAGAALARLGAILANPLIHTGRKMQAEKMVHDAFTTFDKATMDSAGAFLIGELERLDPMIHEPLVSLSWDRDVPLRSDVQMGDTSSSYTTSTFGAVGGVAPNGIAWAGKETTTLPRINLDIAKIVNPLNLWAHEVAYTLPELESARITGRPIDTQMLSALNLKHQMDTDQLAYIGDSTIGTTGLLNSALVTNVATVPADGTASATTFASKTADQIRRDVNEVLVSVWAASGYAAPPTKLLLSPAAFGYISTTIASTAANTTILRFLEENNILTAEKGLKLEIKSCKWLAQANRAGATSDRMVAYSQRPDYVRFPLVPLMAASVQFEGIWVKVPYYGRLGVVETVYPETIAYRDGI
jgi:hypothetical protein